MNLFKEYVVGDLRRWRAGGARAALVTLVGIHGSSPRPLGAQMAVRQDGRSVGFLTGGCAEEAIVQEAVAAIEAGETRCVRYGEGSPYIDVQLPCGSGIDVYFDTCISDEDIQRIDDAYTERAPCVLEIDIDRGDSRVLAEEDAASDRLGPLFRRAYAPNVRLLAIGKGPILLSLTRLAQELGFDCVVFSPEADTLAQARDCGAETRALSVPSAVDLGRLDQWTAAALVFHDHEWEPPTLKTLLGSECFYVGALGSRRTHETRLALLEEMGVDRKAMQRIYGPIGLDIGAKSPSEIAVSVIAEIIAVQRGRTV